MLSASSVLSVAHSIIALKILALNFLVDRILRILDFLQLKAVIVTAAIKNMSGDCTKRQTVPPIKKKTPLKPIKTVSPAKLLMFCMSVIR